MPTSDADRVTKAIAYLETRWRDQPDLEEVAGAVGLSGPHFQRLFKRWAGVSPKRFLQYLTAEHARDVLRTSKSVLDASYDVGLSGPGRLHDLTVHVHALTPGEIRRAGEGVRIHHAFAGSPFGECLLGWTDRGVCALFFVDEAGREAVLEDLRARWPGAELVPDARRGREVAGRVFEGAADAALDVRGTNFQIRVWEALLRIPEGALVTYGDLARSLGAPRGARAVGAAVGRNPVAWLIPCHRVIRGTGVFGEYRWGSAKKKALVGWEAARRERGARA